jgi:Uma2 family endonuclease
MTTMHAAKLPTPTEIRRAQCDAGVEFVNGLLVEKSTSSISNYVSRRIFDLLDFEAHKTGLTAVFGSAMGYQCFPEDQGTFRRPSLSVVRSERLSSRGQHPGLLPIPADLAVEVYSPDELACDVDEKIDAYLGAGFRIVWGVTPKTRTVMIYRADGSVARLHENDEITGETALPTFRCKVAEFFVMLPR